MNALTKAVKKGDVAAVQTLLSDNFNGDHVTQVDTNGWNVFHYIAAYDAQQTIIKLFSDLPTSLLTSQVLDKVNKDRETPLQIAVRLQRADIAIGLLGLGADTNTALRTAIKVDSPYLVKVLVAFGADVNLVVDGSTPLQKSYESKAANRNEIIKILEDVGATKVPTQSAQQTAPPTSNTGVTGTLGDRVLSLDGGGIRGLVEILILQAIETAAGRPIKDCFDWVGGTSTGGILAMALVHGYSPRYCLGLYMKLKDQIFCDSKPYAVDHLESFLQREFGTNTDMMELPAQPRVVVTSVMSDSIPAKLCLFRNYEKPTSDAALKEETEYVVTIRTGDEYGAGTDANIFITLFGKYGKKSLQSPRISLGQSEKSRNQLDNYKIKTTNCGRLTKIRIEMQGGGAFASWYVDCVVVTERNDTRWKYYFPCKQWIEEPEEGQYSGIDIDSLSKVWQAARATSAAPMYFESFHHHLDGGLIANNPTLDVMTEIEQYYAAFQKKLNLDVVVSLGTGKFNDVHIDECDIHMPRLSGILNASEFISGAMNFIEVLVNEVTEPNGRPVERATSWCRSLDIAYYRLNAELSEGIDLDCTDNDKLVNMLYETQRFIFTNKQQIKQLALRLRR